MAIDLGQSQKDSLEAQGVITDESTLSGDLSGTLPNPVVAAIRGQALADGPFAAGLGYRHDGTGFILTTLLNEDSTFGGDVSGSQVTGLTVGAIDGVPVEAPNPSNGQILQYNGSNWAAVTSDLGDAMRVESTSITAGDNDHILMNTTSAATTVTTPASPSAGDRFVVYDSHGTFGTNTCSVVAATGDDINGTDTINININNAIVEFIYNGSQWRYFVMSVRA